jgi:PAS domain S-box-containing protein
MSRRIWADDRGASFLFAAREGGVVRLGLRGRFIVCVSAIVIAFGLALSALAVRIQNERLRHELVERGKLLGTVVAANATDALVHLEVGDLRQLMAEARSQENVIDAVAFDDEGRVLTDGTVENSRRFTFAEEAVRRHLSSSDALLVDFSGDVMTVTKPVSLGGRRFGGISLQYSLAGLARDQTLLARRTALVGTAIALLGVLSAALLAGTVIRPLREVIAATRAVSAGESVPFLRVRSPDEVGELAEAFNIMTQRLRETTVSRDELDLILEKMGECLVVTATDGSIVRVNRATCRLTGVDEADLISKNIRRLFRAPDGFPSLLQVAASGDAVQGVQTDLMTACGDSVPVLVSVAPFAGSSVRSQGYVVLAADLSERLRIEEQKDEFVTMVHHEIRAPLTAVRGAIGLISGGVAGELGDSARDLVDIALRNSERMERLVSDILASRKLDSGRMDFHLQEMDPDKLVNQAIEATAAYGQKFDVGFVLEGGVGGARVRVDPDRFIQVLTNVLSNAVRYSPAGEIVRVVMSRVGELVRIAVIDRGPGIADDFKDRVFEKFARADDGSWRHRSGTGLGMSISKGIMEELGGAIYFETVLGSGTTFFVDLPATG